MMSRLQAHSLRVQLLFSLVMGVIMILGIFWWLTQVSLHELSDRYVVTRLEHDAQSIEDHLVKREGDWHLDHWSIGPIYLAENSGHYYEVSTPSKLLISPSLKSFRIQKPQNLVTEPMVYKVRGPVENVLLVLALPMTLNGENLTIYVAENHDPIREVLIEFDTLFAILTLIALLSIYGFQRMILNNAFRQFKPLEAKLQSFQKGEKVEIKAEEYPLEVRSLVESLNLTLQKSHQQFERSRQLNSDLSHSLKTPLNVIFQQLETPELQQYPKLQAALRHEAQRIYEKIEYQLKAERFANHQVVALLEIAPISKELEQTFSRLYQDKALRFDFHIAPSLSYRLEQEDAYELFGNLLDNACKWAKSTVVMHADAQGFSIEDDGGGVSPEEQNKLQQRGYRSDETMPGHGIGLSIVKRLVQAYGMTLQLSKSELGGLKITVTFAA